jgi:hypothetical protein
LQIVGAVSLENFLAENAVLGSQIPDQDATISAQRDQKFLLQKRSRDVTLISHVMITTDGWREKKYRPL